MYFGNFGFINLSFCYILYYNPPHSSQPSAKKGKQSSDYQ